jgi:hypothetical protein
MSGEVMVMAVRLITTLRTLRINMNLTTGINITREVEVVIHLHHSLPDDHHHIPNLEMNVSNKSNDASNNSVTQTHYHHTSLFMEPVAYAGIFFGGGGVTPGIFFRVRSSTNLVEDREQRERESGGGSPLVRGSTQFVN